MISKNEVISLIRKAMDRSYISNPNKDTKGRHDGGMLANNLEMLISVLESSCTRVNIEAAMLGVEESIIPVEKMTAAFLKEQGQYSVRQQHIGQIFRKSLSQVEDPAIVSAIDALIEYMNVGSEKLKAADNMAFKLNLDTGKRLEEYLKSIKEIPK